MCNPAFETLFQYSPKELSSADLDDLIAGPEMADEAACLSGRVMRGNKVHTVTQRRRRDGMMVDVEVYGIPLCFAPLLARPSSNIFAPSLTPVAINPSIRVLLSRVMTGPMCTSSSSPFPT